jgi:UDP-N-acetylmuramate--alanine ligase
VETTTGVQKQQPGSPANVDLDLLSGGTVHFVGIGGIGMSALARLLLGRGIKVSGSDKSANPITEELAALGATVFIGHQAGNLSDSTAAIVVSTAITKDNPELAAAGERSLPVWHRSQVLFALGRQYRLIAISGTHGKTTTTGMMAQVLLDNGLDPTVVVGGIFEKLKANSHLGKGEYFVAEADESDRTHAAMQSEIALVTNIERDHMENYPGGIAEVCSTMLSFANNASRAVVICVDDPGCRQIMPEIKKRMITYGEHGVSPAANFTMEDGDGFKFSVRHEGRFLGEVELAVPGKHNKLNALSVIAAAIELGIDFRGIALSLADFHGVARRFQHLGTESGVTVVDDYGHHPTEVVATLQAARQYVERTSGLNRVVAVFQPHQPGRLRDLWSEFCEAFAGADLVLLSDVYVARGGQIEGIDSGRFSQELKHASVTHLPGSTLQLHEKILPHLCAGDLVLTIGAGDITDVGPRLLAMLKNGLKNGSCI